MAKDSIFDEKFNHDFINNLKPGSRFVIVEKENQHQKSSFKTPIEIVVREKEDTTVPNSADHNEMESAWLIKAENGMEILLENSLFSIYSEKYELYLNYQDWLEEEKKIVVAKKNAITAHKEYLKNFASFYREFYKENPEKLI